MASCLMFFVIIIIVAIVVGWVSGRASSLVAVWCSG